MSTKGKTRTAVDYNNDRKGNKSKTTAAPKTVADLADFDLSLGDGGLGWNNLDLKFYELTAMLSAPTSGLNANQARLQQKQAVSIAIGKLLDLAQQECRRLLVEGNAKAAVEGGLKTLKLKEEYYGPGSLQLVPSYFHMARTNQYMDKFKAAEEFLSLAQWTILKHPDADVSLKAELHQTFGLLYASDSKLDAALKQLTCATYYLSVMNGPQHILTSFGYFDLGNVFAAKSAMENAMAFYDKVKEIWHAHLLQSLKLIHEAQQSETDMNPDSVLPYATPAAFGDENLQDAVKMLRGIVGLQCERFGRVHPSSGRAEEVLGMFMLWNGDAVSALDSMLRALEVSKRVYGDRHPNTSGIRSLLLQFGLTVPDDTSNVLQALEEQEEDEEDEEDQTVEPPAAADTTTTTEQQEEQQAAPEEPAQSSPPAEEAVQSQPPQQPKGELWKALKDKFPPTEKGPEGRAKRMELFTQFDPNGNGYLSLAEIDAGCRKILQLDELTNDLAPILIRAFTAAKDAHQRKGKKKKHDDDYVEKSEFRLFFVNLRVYFELWSMFDAIDTGDDRRVNFDEFQQAVPTIESWGVKIDDAKAEFDTIDKNSGGQILFQEFAEWAMKKNLDLPDDGDSDEENSEEQQAEEPAAATEEAAAEEQPPANEDAAAEPPADENAAAEPAADDETTDAAPTADDSEPTETTESTA